MQVDAELYGHIIFLLEAEVHVIWDDELTDLT
jgi:hypothetical protein